MQEKVAFIVGKDSSTRSVNGEIITEWVELTRPRSLVGLTPRDRHYLDNVMEEANEVLQDQGQLTLTSLAQQYALPADLIQEVRALNAFIGLIARRLCNDAWGQRWKGSLKMALCTRPLLSR